MYGVVMHTQSMPAGGVSAQFNMAGYPALQGAAGRREGFFVNWTVVFSQAAVQRHLLTNTTIELVLNLTTKK